MIKTAYVLAAMLRVGQPGHADLSRVYLPFDECDSQCLNSFRIQDRSIPSLNFGPSSPSWKNPPIWLGWSIKETRGQGLARYVTIARAISIVAEDPPENWPRTEKTKRALAHLLITISRHESAWWRGVHDGTHRGPAGEKGLFQVHPALKEEFASVRLGVDLDSTVSQVEIAAELLGRFWSLCAGDVRGTIAAYGSGYGCTPRDGWVDGVEKRMKTFQSTFRPVKFGGEEVIALLYSQPGFEAEIPLDSLRR